MANKNTTKREELLNKSLILFYENGVKKTSFDLIAKECGVTSALIVYHFKDKTNLLSEVIATVTSRMKNAINEQMYLGGINYDVRTASVVEMLYLFGFTSTNDKMHRFYVESLNIGIDAWFTQSYFNVYKIHDRHFKLDIDREGGELEMLAISSYFSGIALLYSYLTGKLNVSYDNMLDYAILNQFKLMHYSEKKAQEFLNSGKEIYGQINKEAVLKKVFIEQ